MGQYPADTFDATVKPCNGLVSFTTAGHNHHQNHSPRDKMDSFSKQTLETYEVMGISTTLQSMYF